MPTILAACLLLAFSISALIYKINFSLYFLQVTTGLHLTNIDLLFPESPMFYFITITFICYLLDILSCIAACISFQSH